MLPSPRTTPTVSHKHSVQTQSPRVAGSRRADSGLGSSRVPSVSQHEISKPKKMQTEHGRRSAAGGEHEMKTQGLNFHMCWYL